MIQALVTPLTGWHVGRITSSSLTAVLILGLLGTGYGTILYFRLITDIGATLASSVDYLVPVFAVMFGVILTGEPVAPSMLGGMVLILVGMGLGEGHLTTQLRRLWTPIKPHPVRDAGKGRRGWAAGLRRFEASPSLRDHRTQWRRRHSPGRST